MAENNFQNLAIFNSLLIKAIWTNPMLTGASFDVTLGIFQDCFLKHLKMLSYLSRY